MAGSGRKNGDTTLVLALAAGTTVKDAAAQAGMGERTVYRRLENVEFQQRVTAARSEMVSRAVGLLADAATDAVSTMRGLLSAESESVRLGAARGILELGTRLRETVELAAELQRLKDTVAERIGTGDHGTQTRHSRTAAARSA